MDDEICLPMPPIEINRLREEHEEKIDIDELNVSIIQNTIYEMQDTIINLEIENKNLKAVIDTKCQLINDLQNSMINSEDYVDDEQHKSYEAFLDYYKTNKDHIYRNLKNIMIKKGLYRTPRLAENIVNTHGMKLYNESIRNK
jgi:uncharacterized iron-regulated protein